MKLHVLYQILRHHGHKWWHKQFRQYQQTNHHISPALIEHTKKYHDIWRSKCSFRFGGMYRMYFMYTILVVCFISGWRRYNETKRWTCRTVLFRTLHHPWSTTPKSLYSSSTYDHDRPHEHTIVNTEDHEGCTILYI